MMLRVLEYAIITWPSISYPGARGAPGAVSSARAERAQAGRLRSAYDDGDKRPYWLARQGRAERHKIFVDMYPYGA